VKLTILFSKAYSQTFSWCFRDPIRVHRIGNRVPKIRENYHRVPKIRNRVPTGPHRVPNIFLKNTLISHFTNNETMLATAKHIIGSFWVKLYNWSKLTKHRTTVRSETAVGKSVWSGKLCANVICPNVWRHTHRKS